jgi:primosomal protein N'
MIEKRANMFTWTILLKSNDINQLHNLLKTFEINYKPIAVVRYKADIDPIHLN